jgi:hypothetical protein
MMIVYIWQPQELCRVNVSAFIFDMHYFAVWVIKRPDDLVFLGKSA